MRLINAFILIIIVNIILWWNLGYSLVPRINSGTINIENVVKDKSIFKYKESQQHLPSWIDYSTSSIDFKNNIAALYIDNVVLAIFKAEGKILSDSDALFIKSLTGVDYLKLYKKNYRIWRDSDGDKIPDSLDVQIGMYKTVRNAASYLDKYIRLKFPYGDVPKEIGVCTDVVIRSLLNAGLSLQKMIYHDMQKRKVVYRGFKGKKPDYSIEHRRVRRLIVYFKKNFKRLPASFVKTKGTNKQWLPGDILFMSLIPGDNSISHIGIVSGNKFISQFPLLIHNTAAGFHTAEMDILWFQKIKFRFRIF